MKTKEVKKRKARLKTKNISQLELKFIENPTTKNKDFSQIQTINFITIIVLSSFLIVSFF